MKHILLISLTFLIKSTFAQNPWVPTNSPVMSRYDDIFFISPDTGWAAGNGGAAQILHTIDGGTTWSVQKTITASYMRSVEFANKNIGFAGSLESGGQNVFFKTTDGGITWTDISSVITGTNRGICGICCVNTSITYAVGVYSTPSYVMKTIDGGNTWTQINMGNYAKSLVDVQFTDANNGYVTGQSNINSEGAVILKTSDGGVTWTKVYTSNIDGEYVWKIQNLDGINWFACIEGVGGGGGIINNVFIKSTDGGVTWITKPVGPGHYLQGIGFINSQKGWTGNQELFETNDGGDTWAQINTNQGGSDAFNRFQRLNTTTAYFSSNIIHKLGGVSTGVKSVTATSEKPKWLTVYPNPTKDEVSYKLDLPNKTMLVTRLFNPKNEIIYENVYQKEKGTHHLKIDKKLPSGIYMLYIMFNEHVECEKVIIE